MTLKGYVKNNAVVVVEEDLSFDLSLYEGKNVTITLDENAHFLRNKESIREQLETIRASVKSGWGTDAQQYISSQREDRNVW